MNVFKATNFLLPAYRKTPEHQKVLTIALLNTFFLNAGFFNFRQTVFIPSVCAPAHQPYCFVWRQWF